MMFTVTATPVAVVAIAVGFVPNATTVGLAGLTSVGVTAGAETLAVTTPGETSVGPSTVTPETARRSCINA